MENVMRKPEIMVISDSDLLASPTVVEELNLSIVSEEDVKDISHRELFTLTRGGTFNSVALWFNVRFETEAKSLSLSTGPSAPPTHWKQTLIPLEKSKNLKKGDKILCDLFLDQSQENLRQYVIQFEILDEENTELHPVPCLCHSYKCDSALALINALNDDDDDNIEEI
ncbi:Uncharacterized protein FKW44_000039 [Caligus rogercresseyi]|uniref:Protein arginine N-methyltransferase domain-containing protein n=1 Tax=Caligus rogercresseyi TaxID=217165 RepID=A0A7T8QUK5_CALRO|nr:Uncharacterized protein FKW44_000039 [Caligus rogercresseyi]